MKIGVLGSGAFGLALSSILVNNNHQVTIWSYSKDEQEQLNKTRRCHKLPGYLIPQEIIITNDISKTVLEKDLIIMAIPAFAFEDTTKLIKPYLKKNQLVLIATKGIQQNTCLFLSDVFSKYCSNKIGIISGPTFAIDIINQVPIGFSLATRSKNVALVIEKAFANKQTKLRRTNDIIGVEICGSIKNVMAIASGILAGMKVTDSTRALFLTESMNDIKELIKALGGKKQTILSFSGFGDILMTCTSLNSRNYQFGYLIGTGASEKEINKYLNNTTVEGMYTLKSIRKLVRKNQVKMPIINLIYDIIINGKDKEKLLSFLIKKD